MEIPENILILGAGMHGRVVAGCLEQDARYAGAELAFLDDAPHLQGAAVDGIPVIGELADFERVAADRRTAAIIGVGNRHMLLRGELYRRVRRAGRPLVTARHPTAIVDGSGRVGEGCYLGPGVIVNALADIGPNCVFYSGAVVEHECELAPNVYVGPRVVFTADVHVAGDTFIGANTALLPHARVGSRVTVGASSVVRGEVADCLVVAGVPARQVGTNDDGVRF